MSDRCLYQAPVFKPWKRKWKYNNVWLSYLYKGNSILVRRRLYIESAYCIPITHVYPHNGQPVSNTHKEACTSFPVVIVLSTQYTTVYVVFCRYNCNTQCFDSYSIKYYVTSVQNGNITLLCARGYNVNVLLSHNSTVVTILCKFIIGAFAGGSYGGICYHVLAAYVYISVPEGTAWWVVQIDDHDTTQKIWRLL